MNKGSDKERRRVCTYPQAADMLAFARAQSTSVKVADHLVHSRARRADDCIKKKVGQVGGWRRRGYTDVVQMPVQVRHWPVVLQHLFG